MAGAVQKELKKLHRELERQGWTVIQTKNGHWQYRSPDGVGLVHGGGTPSDHRALDNLIARLRKYGFVWKGR